MTTSAPFRAVIAFSEAAQAEDWIRLAQRIVPPHGEIHLRGMVTIPEGISLSEGTTSAQTMRDSLNQLSLSYPIIQESTVIKVDYRPLGRILEELTELNAGLLVVQWAGPEALTGGLYTKELLQNTPCDVALIYGEGWQQEGSVLLSLRGGPNLTLGVKIARGLAAGAPITLFHATDQLRGNANLKPLMRAEPQISRSITARNDFANSLAREVADHKVVVMGASLPAESSGSPSETIHKLHRQSSKTLSLW